MKIRATMFAGLIAAVCLGLFGTSASAATFSLAGDFSGTQNGGSNPWSYGAYGDGFGPYTLTPTGFTPFNKNIPNDVTGTSVYQVWEFTDSADTGSDPVIFKNTGSTDTSFSGVVFPGGQVTFGPYLGPTVARFTAPTNGVYTISAMFQTIQDTSINSAPDAYVYENSTQLAHLTNIPGTTAFGGTGDFATYASGPLDLAAGTTLDIVVWGDNAHNASTEVIATITELPEPSMLVALCGLGAAGLVLVFRRRRRTT